MNFQIKNRWNGSVIFECEALSIRAAVEMAVEKRVSLRAADLRAADLSTANLRAADLSAADLRAADLRAADLSTANLRAADLSAADLRAADLSAANLSDADLRAANLRAADLSDAKEDFLSVLSVAKAETLGLYDALMRGKVDGTQYEGECACLVGTIANLRGEHHNDLKIGLRPMSNRPSERWFLHIRKGDIPQNNPVSEITAEWAREFMDKEGIKYPAYEIVARVPEQAV